MSGFRFALVCTGVSVWLLCQECSLPAELNRSITRLLEPSFTSRHTVRESTYSVILDLGLKRPGHLWLCSLWLMAEFWN